MSSISAVINTSDGGATVNYAGENWGKMRQTLENIQSKSSSIVKLGTHIDEYFDSIVTSVVKQKEEIELKSKKIDWKLKYIKKRSRDVEEREREVKEMVIKMEEIAGLMREKEESSGCDELERLRRNFDKCKEYWEGLRVNCEEKELNLERRELLIENRENEVELKAKKLNSVECELLKRFEEVEERERSVESKAKSKRFKGCCEGFDEEGDYADIRINCVMNGKALQMFLNGRVNDHEILRDEVTIGISLSADPAKLVLDALQGFYPEDDENVGFDLNVVRKSCVLLLEQLVELKPEIMDHVRERAIKVAMEWKRRMNVVGMNNAGCCLEKVGFLQLVASYGLMCKFRKDELLSLFEECVSHDRAPELCRNLGFTDDVHVIIQNIVLRDQPFEAIRLVYAFDLINLFPPVPILRRYLKSVYRNADTVLKNGNTSMEVQIKYVKMKLAALESVVKCIKDYGLESKYIIQPLEQQIMKLKTQIRKCLKPTSKPKSKISIEDEELCISIKPSLPSDKETASLTSVSPEIPRCPTDSRRRLKSVCVVSHHDLDTVDGPLSDDNNLNPSPAESPYLSNASEEFFPGSPDALMGPSPGRNHEHTFEAGSSGVHPQSQNNPSPASSYQTSSRLLYYMKVAHTGGCYGSYTPAMYLAYPSKG